MGQWVSAIMDTYIEEHIDKYQIMARYRTPNDTMLQKCIRASQVKQVKLLVEVLEKINESKNH